MERAAPPRRPIPSFGDALSLFAALLGIVLLVATARHLFWSDASVAVTPGAAPLAQIAPTAAPAALKRVASKPAIRASRARPSVHQHHVARHDAARHDVPRRAARHDVPRHDALRHKIARQGHANVAMHPSRPAAQRGAQRPQTIARRTDARIQPIAHPTVAHARGNVRVGTRQRPRPRAAHIAAVSPRTRSLPAARTAFVATRAQRDARARRAAIIEPPLGYQTHVTLVELPAALGLDLGRDSIPALQIRRKHRH